MKHLASRLGWFAALALGLLTLAAVPAASEEPSNKQQIAEIERQIADLNRKLADLRKAPTTSAAMPEGTLPSDWVKKFAWRDIGPAAMGGRIVALSVYEADPATYWVATASGGLLKTVNNGITFEHQFDREATVSIGDVCVAPSNRDIVWVGTGENNPRNSVSYGDGVYKSTDGGKQWKNVGLKRSFQIGKILIHPKDPNTVYVGALGRLYGSNEERGLYKTTDGGQTWTKILHVDDKTGVIDMRMKPDDPNSLIVATWERQRDGFDSHPGNEMPPAEGYDRYDPIKKWGPGSGLHKTADGGKTWKKLTQGLPTNPMGRIGLDVYYKDPKTVYAIIDCSKIGMGTPPRQTYLGVQGEDTQEGPKVTTVTENSPGAKAGLKVGDIITAVEKNPVKEFQPLVQLVQSKKSGDKLTLSVKRGTETLTVVVTLEDRPGQAQGGPGGRGGAAGGRGGAGGGRGGAGGGGRGGMAGAMLLGALGEDAEGGVRVGRVVAGSAAERAGIREGDLLKTLEKKPIESFQSLVEALASRNAGDKITLQYVRGGETKDVAVTLQSPPQGFGPGGATSTRPYNFMYGGQQPNVQDRQGANSHEYGGLYKSTDFGETWTRINSINPRPMYFSQVRVDPSDEKYLYILGVSLHRSNDGGKTFTDDGGRTVHPDHHALWINPRDGRHAIVGCDGGFYATYDRMENWDYLNHLAIGQFYHVAIDHRRPYRVYGGLQDNASWGGPSHAHSGTGPINEDWIVLGGGDGFVCRVDHGDPDLVYWESQDGNIQRRHLKTGEVNSIRPAQQPGTSPYRFNWNTPYILSSHNSRIFYSAGNYVFRSLDRGRDLRVISPEITRTKRGSASALAESPRNPDVLWVGSDDGALWVTKDGGKNWTNVSDKVGLPGPRWVATIEPSRGADGRCYVVFDGHRSDDDEPYVYRTEDFGQTWTSLRGNLPWGSTRVCREDIKNPNILYLGTEFGAWASLNRGESWTKINNNLPTVAVHEFAQHPTAGEMVAATHGRSLWVLDVTPLRQMSKETLTAKAKLYEPNGVVQWRRDPDRGSIYGTGNRRYAGKNAPQGAQIYYSLSAKPNKVGLKVLDYAGKTVAELQAPSEAGLNHLTWNLARGVQQAPRPQGGGGGGGGGGGAFGGFRAFGGRLTAGMYRVVLNVDGEESSQPLRIEDDPTTTPSLIAAEETTPEEKKPTVTVDF